MNKWPYTKPAITCAEQVNLLRSRGMTVEDPAEAEFYLQHLNYYRLGAYWLHHLTLVRNVCAHHSRLWNREFSVTPMLPQKPSTLATQFQPRSRKVYNALLMLMHCMDRIAPRHHWRRRLLSLIDQHAIPVASIGAPADWKSQPLWQEVAP